MCSWYNNYCTCFCIARKLVYEIATYVGTYNTFVHNFYWVMISGHSTRWLCVRLLSYNLYRIVTMVTRTKKESSRFQHTEFFFIGVNISFAFHHKLIMCTIILLSSSTNHQHLIYMYNIIYYIIVRKFASTANTIIVHLWNKLNYTCLTVCGQLDGGLG